jgi:glucosamine 6-phosphate synthetase-like amidotransferase/phosphosugar isomerase protein
MCGIFGFYLKKPLSMTKVFEVLKKLEISRYPDEDQPLGGYGAGVAVMLKDGDVISEKVGKTQDSPVAQLAGLVKPQLKNAQVLLGHVRFPSPQYMSSVKYKESAQPYVENFEKDLSIVCVHNGNVENYKELQSKLKTHVFESEKIGLIDSEVVPHYFGEMLNELESTDAAVYELLCAIKGSSAAALLQIDEENAFLHLIHKGSARGLIVWANGKGEVIFCSRPEPVQEELSELLVKGKFMEKIVINWKEEAGLKLSFPVVFQ